jgi:hypothetical protein
MMTVERRIVVGLEDIKAVSFECKKCRMRITSVPDDIKEIPEFCRCGQAWESFDPEGYKTARSPFAAFVKAIGKIRDQLGNNAIGYRILLEFDEREAEPKPFSASREAV